MQVLFDPVVHGFNPVMPRREVCVVWRGLNVPAAFTIRGLTAPFLCRLEKALGDRDVTRVRLAGRPQL